MEFLTQVPKWFGAAILAAIIAALGHVAKLLLETIREALARRRVRRARLVQLFSLLSAGKVTYDVQLDKRNRLDRSITKRDESLKSIKGFEERSTAAFPKMTKDERELHSVIRAYTEHTIRPLNEAILQWLKKDTYFKAYMGNRGKRATLARRLSHLEAHLLLWQAKYPIWIPDHPEHSLVYLADEKDHGLGFPIGIESDVLQAIKPGISASYFKYLDQTSEETETEPVKATPSSMPATSEGEREV